jgi:UDP-glucose 4-epimerase
MVEQFWNRRRVLVTGGASFIGSHLTEALVNKGACVRVVDDLSSGKLTHLSAIAKDIEFRQGDLKHWDVALEASRGCEAVFHLAANHGGRGYIASHPADCAANMALDNIVFETATRNGAERIVFASSACVYPTDLQQDDRILLTEDMAGFVHRGGAFADEEYGWAKLMGELSLRAFHRQYGVKTASVRISTAYGPRENETHAVIALIAKSFIRQDPFEIWGDGGQSRGFTYVDDIVDALLLAGQRIEDGTAVNAGSDRFVTVNELAEAIHRIMGWEPAVIRHQAGFPVGVRHRALDGSLAQHLMGWKPKIELEDGLRRTVEYYQTHHRIDQVAKWLQRLLAERDTRAVRQG